MHHSFVCSSFSSSAVARCSSDSYLLLLLFNCTFVRLICHEAICSFTGCLAWCRGEVLAYNAATGRHHIGYDDGEDEWIVLESESVVWVQPPGLHPFCAGLDAGRQDQRAAACAR